jgi:hypothetical protein
MKKSKLFTTIAAALLLAAASRLLAEDSSKEVTITGQAVCAKCVLHETKTCQNVIQAEKDGKTVNYYLAQNDVSKSFHDTICQTSGEKVTATGIVSEKDGKEILTASKIEPVK